MSPSDDDSGAESAIDLDEFVALVAARAERADRYLLGLVGPPGVGKSTLSGRLRSELDAVVAPMDGFHMTNAELDRLGQRHRKGAPHTFSGNEFIEAVRSLRDCRTTQWPSFDRSLDEPVTDGAPIPGDAPFVVVEGNYLLLNTLPWSGLESLFDDVAYLELNSDVRQRRLLERHVEFGRSEDDARRHIRESDELNTLFIEASKHAATIFVRVP